MKTELSININRNPINAIIPTGNHARRYLYFFAPCEHPAITAADVLKTCEHCRENYKVGKTLEITFEHEFFYMDNRISKAKFIIIKNDHGNITAKLCIGRLEFFKLFHLPNLTIALFKMVHIRIVESTKSKTNL